MPRNSLPHKPISTSLPGGACGRTDLLYALALANGDAEREAALAEILGFHPRIKEPQEPLDTSNRVIEPKPPVSEIFQTTKIQPRGVFRPYRLVAVDNLLSNEEWQADMPDTSDIGVLSTDDRGVWDAAVPLPKATPIVPWTRLWPRLRQAVARRHAAGIDFPRLTDRLSKGLALRRLPRLERLSWPNPLTVVLDFSDRLTPYWDDWHWLRRQLESCLHKQVRFYRLDGVSARPLQPLVKGRPSGQFINWPKLGNGETLLLVSDLGMVDTAHPWPRQCWQTD
jgi:hypothetical protein